MVSIVLLILKIIGITLLSIIGVILAVLLLILCVPIRYRLQAEKKDAIDAHIQISWLCRLVYIKIDYGIEKLVYSLRILGYQIIASDKKKKKKRVKSRNSSKKNQCDVAHNLPQEDKMVLMKQKDVAQSVIEEEENSQNEPVDEKQSIFEKIKGFFRKIWATIKGIKEKIRKIRSLVKRMFKQFGLVKQFILEEKNRPGFQVLFGASLRTLKLFFPRKLECTLRFGTGDPCSTGQLLGILCLIYPEVINTVTIVPEFEEKIFEGEVYGQGRMYLVTLIHIVIQVIRDKEFKYLKKEFMRLKEEF